MAHVSTNNQGYFFENNFDTFLYLMLSVIYPILGFFIELGQINASDIGACYDVLTTGLLFTATFLRGFRISWFTVGIQNLFVSFYLFYSAQKPPYQTYFNDLCRIITLKH